MKYIEYVNQLIGKKTAETERIVLFGQNISTGSKLSGLTKNLQVGKGGMVINTPNAENSLTGIGFGLMIGGVPSVFFMKQQDFLLLGIEQLVDTYNFIRRKEPTISFTIVFIIVDLGYHGPQSSINNFGDFSSIARIPGFTITNNVDAKEIIETHLVSPGFRIIGVSQRLFGSEVLEMKKLYAAPDTSIFQYTEGGEATIVCFNLSLPNGAELYQKLKEQGKETSLFSVNKVTPPDWTKIIENAQKTKNLVVIDDSKSENLSADNLLVRALQEVSLEKTIVIRRKLSVNWTAPQPDQLEVDYEGIVGILSAH